MTKLDLFWTTNPAWYEWKGTERVLKADAPDEAKKSYKHYQEQLKKHKDAI